MGLQGVPVGYDRGTYVTKYSTPLSIFKLFFFETIQLLVAEKNTYYHQYLDTVDEGQCPLPGVMFGKHVCFW